MGADDDGQDSPCESVQLIAVHMELRSVSSEAGSLHVLFCICVQQV